jgi:hypothetical protein
MRLIPLPSGTSFKLYGSIFELQAGRHAEFQHWLVRDADIGADAAAIEARFGTTMALLGAERCAEAGDALALLLYAFNDALDKFSPRQLAFGCLVAEVDGRPCNDFTEEGLRRLIEELSAAGLTEGMVVDEVNEVKKNCRRN